MGKAAARHAKPESRTKSTKARGVRLQYGALPYRVSGAGALELLLVTTRESQRWIIPKGGPIKGLKPPQSAAQEAYEEAGIKGRIKSRAIGRFRFQKNLYEKGISVPCEVTVFPLHVAKQLKTWPEREQRVCRWFEAEEAVLQLADESLARLVWDFIERMAPVA